MQGLIDQFVANVLRDGLEILLVGNNSLCQKELDVCGRYRQVGCDFGKARCVIDVNDPLCAQLNQVNLLCSIPDGKVR